MRTISLPIIFAGSALLISGCATSSQQKQLAADVQKLQAQVAELDKKLSKQKIPIVLPNNRSFSHKADNEKLTEIKFPAEQTEENLKNYINAIIVASQGQTSFSPNDPQVSMFALVGNKNLKLLLDALPTTAHGGMGSFHLDYAIKQLATDADRDLILKALPTHPRLVSLVLEKGWAEDARDILITELKNSPASSLNTDWIKAVVSLNDPSTYDLLTQYLVNSNNPSYVYELIERLPDIKLDDAVAQAWTKAKTAGHDFQIAQMAPIALDYGHQDAIDALIEILKKPPTRFFSSLNPRLTLITHLDFRGSNEELFRWYEENKNALVFDPGTKRFKVEKKTEPETSETTEASEN